MPTTPNLDIELNVFEKETIQLNDSAKITMNGVYKVIEGKEFFGDEVVGKWVDNRWCIYAKHDAVFSINSGGYSGDSIMLCGYFRTVRSGSGALIDLSVSHKDGCGELQNSLVPSSLIIRGKIQDGNKIVLRRIRPLNPAPFNILAHRSGGRNSERLGVSENSLEMIKLAQYMGATGIELDVKMTRDGEIIVFHDETFSPRTITGAYLLGKVEDFTLSQIKSFGRLYYGESIPTLEEALSTVVDSTNLTIAWIDVKDKRTVDKVIKIQTGAINYAISKGKNVSVLFGIPSSAIKDAYNVSPYANTTPVLIEYDIDEAIKHKTCKVWGPRWTEDIGKSDIDNIHGSNRLVFTWTLDFYDYITEYLNNKNLDGILSNYPSIVAGLHYSR